MEAAGPDGHAAGGGGGPRRVDALRPGEPPPFIPLSWRHVLGGLNNILFSAGDRGILCGLLAGLAGLWQLGCPARALGWGRRAVGFWRAQRGAEFFLAGPAWGKVFLLVSFHRGK